LSRFQWLHTMHPFPQEMAQLCILSNKSSAR